MWSSARKEILLLQGLRRCCGPVADDTVARVTVDQCEIGSQGVRSRTLILAVELLLLPWRARSLFLLAAKWSVYELMSWPFLLAGSGTVLRKLHETFHAMEASRVDPYL